MTPRLKEIFLKEIQPSLKEKFGLKNLYMGPKINKVVINMGLGIDGNDNKVLKSCEEDLSILESLFFNLFFFTFFIFIN